MQSESVSWIDYPMTQDNMVHDPAGRDIAHARQTSLCSGCQAVEIDRQWCWDAGNDKSPDMPDGNFRTVLCPACQRCRDKQAAGMVTLEIMPSSQIEACLREIVHAESRRMVEDDPMQRIIDIQRQENGLLITTTTIELARAIGEAVQHTMRGHLEMHYQKPAKELRVRWLPWG